MRQGNATFRSPKSDLTEKQVRKAVFGSSDFNYKVERFPTKIEPKDLFFIGEAIGIPLSVQKAKEAILFAC